MNAKPQQDNYDLFSVVETAIALTMILMVWCVEICRSPFKYMRKTTTSRSPLHNELNSANRRRRPMAVDKYTLFTVLVIVVAVAMISAVYAWI